MYADNLLITFFAKEAIVVLTAFAFSVEYHLILFLNHNLLFKLYSKIFS